MLPMLTTRVLKLCTRMAACTDDALGTPESANDLKVRGPLGSY